MTIYRYSSLARSLDPDYPTNRAIIILSLLITLSGTLIHGIRSMAWIESAGQGVSAGLTVFFAWALCRELDPDHELPAFVAAGLATLGLLAGVSPGLLAAIWLLLIVRVLNRTSGLAATRWDSLAVLGLVAWLILQSGWEYALVTAAALLLDGRIRPRHPPHTALAALSILAAGLALLQDPGDGVLAIGPGMIGLGVSALYLPVILRSADLQSAGDRTGEPLLGARVQAAQGIALLAGVLLAFWRGTTGLILMLPLWAAVLGASAYWVWETLSGATRR